MITYYCYNSDGSEYRTRRFFGPGQSEVAHLVTLAAEPESDSGFVWFHMGYGLFRRFEVVAIDQRSALIRDTGCTWRSGSDEPVPFD